MATTRSVGYAIEPPPIAPAPYGLVNSLTVQSGDERWEGGVGFESLACPAEVDLWDLCDARFPLVVRGDYPSGPVTAPAFGITVTDSCTSTMSGSDYRSHAEERVTAMLEAATTKAVESELKWGHVAAAATPVGRWLTGPETVVVDSGGVSPMVAAALLENAYADCGYGGLGLLHASRGAGHGMRGTHTGLHDGEAEDVLYTRTDTPIILGTGYAPSARFSTAPWDGDWMFITGPVMVWLSDIQVYPEVPSVNIATNDTYYKAERLAAVTFDGCCVFAAKVDPYKI